MALEAPKTMDIIGLAGNDPATEAWMQSLVDALPTASAGSFVVRYGHWDDGSRYDIAREAAKLKAIAPDLVLAKSLGVMIALDAHAHRGFEPARAVFMGTPLRLFGDVESDRLRAFVKGVPTLLIQQRDDRTGTYAALEARLSERLAVRMVEVPGHDHAYPREVVMPIITRWLSDGS